MTKEEFRNTLLYDLKRFGGKRPTIVDRFFKRESAYIWDYIVHMRSLEYHTNKGVFHKLAYLWHFYYFKRLQLKLHFQIYPNTLGPGFRIYHVGNFTHVGPNVKIGKNCTMVSGVVFGNKSEVDDNRPVFVGDNVYFGLDCKILGPLHIGNNVSIGANAVVTKDIPDNAIVGGVPAKIIKFKE